MALAQLMWAPIVSSLAASGRVEQRSRYSDQVQTARRVQAASRAFEKLTPQRGRQFKTKLNLQLAIMLTF